MLLDLNMSRPLAERPNLQSARTTPDPAAAPAEITVIVPTYNERANIEELVERIRTGLAGLRWEILVVDDNSPDGTGHYARKLHAHDARVRVIRRVGRRGLSSACIEGMLASSATYVAVIDADLQHDPALLRDMLEILRGGSADLVCASRYAEGGSVGDWAEDRAAASGLATWAARTMTGVALSDPMSGYFAVRRDVIDMIAPALSGVGFKILLDIVLAAGAGLRVAEIPLRFENRLHGDSKLSARVVWDYVMMLAEHRSSGAVRANRLSTISMAVAGLLTNIFALWLLHDLYGLASLAAETIAAIAGCAAVYTTNELLAYRRRGAWRWYLGLLPFLASCAAGMICNLLLASSLQASGVGWFAAACCGAILGMVWNNGAVGRHGWPVQR
jgi:dolichol-phosphate mannosyltransferase